MGLVGRRNAERHRDVAHHAQHGRYTHRGIGRLRDDADIERRPRETVAAIFILRKSKKENSMEFSTLYRTKPMNEFSEADINSTVKIPYCSPFLIFVK